MGPEGIFCCRGRGRWQGILHGSCRRIQRGKVRLHGGEMVWEMEGAWCGIVTCGGIGTGGDRNDEFSGVGICERGSFLCVAWCGVEILAGENMNGVEVGA